MKDDENNQSCGVADAVAFWRCARRHFKFWHCAASKSGHMKHFQTIQ